MEMLLTPLLSSLQSYVVSYHGVVLLHCTLHRLCETRT